MAKDIKTKEIKTNVMRILDKEKIPYKAIQYECDEFIDGLHSAQLSGTPVDATYKTLLVLGKSKQYYVLVIPIAMEVEMKKAARAVKEKSLEMIHVKDLAAITGYVRGGCSPIGMKKLFPTFIDQSAQTLDTMYISGGRVGTSVCLNPLALSKLVGGKFVDLCL